ncbi:MAG: RNA-guided pseudouridylation complex pseudouridine synthase subunit Cbf5 [Nanoarchaeota archaeon]|nr:RNA-guided pseudouridylation complex pseudouridine synthase subunit Cbf5 [Nanoarchaeota archaeon]
MEEKLPFEKIEREILVKREAETNLDYGKKPEERTIKELLDYGVINLNKPQGPTSHQISDYAQRILGIGQAGHSGTLDPNVTGVLPLALGKATRIVQVLLKSGKEYVCLMHLHKEVPQSKIYKTAEEFIGKIRQTPPLKSAVKREERTREIYYLNIYEIEGKDALFKIGCEAGTYIRKICHDWGKKLGIGAHMSQLVRTKAGPFTDKDWITLHDLKDAYEFYKEGNETPLKKIILPMERGVAHLPKVWILDTAADTLCHGADLSTPGISKLHSSIEKNDTVAVMTLKGELVCFGTAKMASEEMAGQEKGLAVTTEKVFMEPGTYPKFVKKQNPQGLAAKTR